MSKQEKRRLEKGATVSNQPERLGERKPNPKVEKPKRSSGNSKKEGQVGD